MAVCKSAFQRLQRLGRYNNFTCTVIQRLPQRQANKPFPVSWERRTISYDSSESASDGEPDDFQERSENSGKVVQLVVTSLRVDRVAASGLGLARRKVDHSLLAGHVFLNGRKVTKKSRLVVDGDTIDSISENQPDKDKIKFGRVKVLTIGELTKKGNYRIEVLRSKSLSLLVQEFWDEHK